MSFWKRIRIRCKYLPKSKKYRQRDSKLFLRNLRFDIEADSEE